MFDARKAKALPAGDHLTVDGAPGLRLTATQTMRTWQYRYKSPVDARMRQIRLGHWPELGLPGALVAWEKLRKLREAGEDPAADKKQRRRAAIGAAAVSSYTVRRACDNWLASYRGAVSHRTYAEVERLLGREIDAIADKPAADVTRADCYSLIDSMRHKPVVAGVVRQSLGAVWDRALDAGEMPDTAANWWRLIMRGKLPSKGKKIEGVRAGPVKRVLSEIEVAALLAWLPNFSSSVADAITLYLWTCCRGAEILAMDRSEISTEQDGVWWTIPKEKLKMRRNPLTIDLRVPLEGRALEVVNRRLAMASGGWLFPSPRAQSTHIAQKTLGVAILTHLPRCTIRPERVRPRLPVADFAPHDLRRTGRTLLASIGCPAEIAEAILGHLPPGIQAVYDRHGYNAERRHWLTLLSQHLEAVAGRAQAPSR